MKKIRFVSVIIMVLIGIMMILVVSCEELKHTNPIDSDSADINPLESVNSQKLSITSIKLTWQEDYDGESGFQIDKRVYNGDWIKNYALVEENSTSYIDSLAEINKHIQYRVLVCYDEHKSKPTDCGIINNSIPAPKNLTFKQIDATTVKLSWVDNSIGEDGFKIDKKTDQGNWITDFATVNENVHSWMDTSTVIGKNYSYRVRAYKEKGDSENIFKSYTYNLESPVVKFVDVNSTYEQGAVISIKANIVSKDVYAEIKNVKFYVDGELKSTGTTLPYSYSWNSGSANSGSHIFKAVAEDNFGNIGNNTINCFVGGEDWEAFVFGGTFQMGSTNGGADEKPIHTVIVSSFLIGKHEVTQKEYETIMGTNPAHDYGVGDNYPVYYVTWYDAVEFCNKLSDLKGYNRCYSGSGSIVCNWSANGYRLPTEAEWEFTCRGGVSSENYKYSGSNNIDDVAWYDSNSGSKTHIVGTKQSNELGIYDMSGNVYEWCWDWYSSYYYKNSPENNPQGPASGSRQILRGGYWGYGVYNCRSAYRSNSQPSSSFNYIGFRVVRTAE